MKKQSQLGVTMIRENWKNCVKKRWVNAYTGCVEMSSLQFYRIRKTDLICAFNEVLDAWCNCVVSLLIVYVILIVFHSLSYLTSTNAYAVFCNETSLPTVMS